VSLSRRLRLSAFNIIIIISYFTIIILQNSVLAALSPSRILSAAVWYLVMCRSSSWALAHCQGHHEEVYHLAPSLRVWRTNAQRPERRACCSTRDGDFINNVSPQWGMTGAQRLPHYVHWTPIVSRLGPMREQRQGPPPYGKSVSSPLAI